MRKFFRYLIFILLILCFLPEAFSENAPLVRIFHVTPRGENKKASTERKLLQSVQEVREFYQNEMSRHGFGHKTFNLDITNGVITWHFFDTDYRVEDFSNNNQGDAVDSLSQVVKNTGIESHVNLFVIDGLDNKAFNIGYWNAGRSSMRAHYSVVAGDLNPSEMGVAIAHELGHAFGLSHGTDNDSVMVGVRQVYGDHPSLREVHIEDHEAHWLDKHKFLNNDDSANIEIDYDYDFRKSKNKVSLDFTSPNIAQIYITKKAENDEVIAYHINSEGKTHLQISFDNQSYSGLYQLQAIDISGNMLYKDSILPIEIQTIDLVGDVNFDGKVDLEDVETVRKAINGVDTGYDTDINNDDVTDEADINIVKIAAMKAIIAASPAKKRIRISTWGEIKRR